MASTFVLIPVLLLGEGIAALARAFGLFDDEQINVKTSVEETTEAIIKQKMHFSHPKKD